MDKVKNIYPCSDYYTLSSTQKHDQGWDTTFVEVYGLDDKKLTEYVYHYPSKTPPFFPFKTKEGKWYALYSESYHRTYVMDLDTGLKVAEDDTLRLDSPYDKSGFCPVKYWIEPFFKYSYELEGEDKILYSEYPGDSNETYSHHSTIGFVAGCYWGNDWEWQIKAIDLSSIESGTIHIYDPDNQYFAMPRRCTDLSTICGVDPDDNGDTESAWILNSSFSIVDNKLIDRD